jgi:predicted nucleotidyltransferase component of viral defense system
MIALESLKPFFPPYMRNIPEYHKYMLKEYIQCQILEFLSNSTYISRLSFIGGTNLRLIKQIDRFSEDLDFDCKEMSHSDFIAMTDSVLRHLSNLGYVVEPRKQEHDMLVAYRRSIYFPQLLFDLQLSGYRKAKFLIKIEMEDQQIPYKTVPAFVRSSGFYFPLPVPPDDVLCSMKLSATLARSKGRDFYDSMFLLSRTKPNYEFLAVNHGIHNAEELKHAMISRLDNVDLSEKQRDVQHLLFDPQRSQMITNFASFIEDLDLAESR